MIQCGLLRISIFYYKIFHIKILSCFQAPLVLYLLHLFKSNAEVLGSGGLGWSFRVFLLCLQQVPFGEELRGHLGVEMVPVPAYIILPRGISLGKMKKSFPLDCSQLPTPSGPQGGADQPGEPAGCRSDEGEWGAAIYLSHFMFWRKHFSEELQVNLAIL
jgi:hypothetical protein